MHASIRNATRTFVAVGVLAVVAACGDSPARVAGLSSSLSALKDGQAVSVTPSSITFQNPGESQVITASTNFAGTITAVSDAANVCTVSPGSADATVTPGAGGTKTAHFTITAGTGGSCTITVTDKKGNTATVSGTVIDAVPMALSVSNPFYFAYVAGNSFSGPPYFCNGGGGPVLDNSCTGLVNVTISGGVAPYFFAGMSGNCGAGIFPLPGYGTYTPLGYQVTGVQVVPSQFDKAIFGGPAGPGNGCSGPIYDSAGHSIYFTVGER